MRIWKSRKQDLDPYIDIPYPEQVLNGLKYAHFEHISQGSDLSKNGAFWMDFSQISGTMCDFYYVFNFFTYQHAYPVKEMTKTAEK